MWKKAGILAPNLEKVKLVNFVLQDSFLKMSFANEIHLHLCHIYIINSNTDLEPSRPGISLFLP